MSRSYRDLFVSAADGLRLYARDYGPETGDALPVICLSGLARNSEDFHELADALSRDPSKPRRVLSLDYRGRGRSDWDPDWHHYDIKVELDDCLHVLAAVGIEKAIVVGTSRGGLIAMALCAAHPELIAGVVMNDVGPVLDLKGLLRIRSYVGKLPTPQTMQEGAQILQRMSGEQFPDFTEEQWWRMARGTWRETDEGLVLSYDANLMKTLEALDLADAPSRSVAPLRQSEIRPGSRHPGRQFRPAVRRDAAAHGRASSGSYGHHGARPGTRPFPRWPSRSGYPRFCRQD